MSYSRTDDTSTIARRQLPACSIEHARAVASEALADLASVQHKLSVHADDMRLKPDYWVGVLQGVTASLLIALEDSSVQVRAS